MSADLIQEAINMEIAIKDGTLTFHLQDLFITKQENLVVPEGENADDGMLCWYGLLCSRYRRRTTTIILFIL